MSIRKTFTLSDESVENTYGFTVDHDTLNTDRFIDNPVMLDMHINDNRSVLGRWLNPRFEGTKYIAETDFDLADKNVKTVAGKVERNFIKGASLGIIFDPVNLYVTKEGKVRLKNGEVLEATICPVPSNKKSISLYSTDGVLLSEAEVKSICLSVTTNTKQIENKSPKTMSKINLSALAIVALASVGVTNTEDESAVSKGIEDLNQKLALANAANENLKTANAGFEAKLTAQKESQAKVMLNQAKLAGKITTEEETEMLADAIANPEGTAKLLAKIPAKTNLSGEVIKTENGGNATDPKNIDEFEKMPLAKQLAFKAENPDGYSAFFA